MKLPKNYDELHYTERKKVREEYVRLQNGICHYCKKPLDEKASDEVMKKKINKRLFPDSFLSGRYICIMTMTPE